MRGRKKKGDARDGNSRDESSEGEKIIRKGLFVIIRVKAAIHRWSSRVAHTHVHTMYAYTSRCNLVCLPCRVANDGRQLHARESFGPSSSVFPESHHAVA